MLLVLLAPRAEHPRVTHIFPLRVLRSKGTLQTASFHLHRSNILLRHPRVFRLITTRLLTLLFPLLVTNTKHLLEDRERSTLLEISSPGQGIAFLTCTLFFSSHLLLWIDLHFSLYVTFRLRKFCIVLLLLQQPLRPPPLTLHKTCLDS